MALLNQACRVKQYLPETKNERMVKAIESAGITKTFGPTKALDNISFSVNESEIFGFIGPDGAGKTTLFRIISTLLVADAGNMKVLGMDSISEYKELRKNIGYMPGRFSLYQDLSVEENLNFYATVFGTTVKEMKLQWRNVK